MTDHRDSGETAALVGMNRISRSKLASCWQTFQNPLHMKTLLIFLFGITLAAHCKISR